MIESLISGLCLSSETAPSVEGHSVSEQTLTSHDLQNRSLLIHSTDSVYCERGVTLRSLFGKLCHITIHHDALKKNFHALHLVRGSEAVHTEDVTEEVWQAESQSKLHLESS